MRYWTLAANPGAFRVKDNVREQDVELWRTSRKVARGDRVGIYKYKGRDSYRGIVSLRGLGQYPTRRTYLEPDHWPGA